MDSFNRAKVTRISIIINDNLAQISSYVQDMKHTLDNFEAKNGKKPSDTVKLRRLEHEVTPILSDTENLFDELELERKSSPAENSVFEESENHEHVLRNEFQAVQSQIKQFHDRLESIEAEKQAKGGSIDIDQDEMETEEFISLSAVRPISKTKRRIKRRHFCYYCMQTHPRLFILCIVVWIIVFGACFVVIALMLQDLL